MTPRADRIAAADLGALLKGCRLVRETVVLEETTSTNDVAAERGRSGAPEGLVVFAETQTAGRGRQGNRWESSSLQGLCFSLLLRPQLPANQWSRLTTWAAVAIAEALEEFIPGRAEIKWPNDVYLSGQKAVGILTEISTDQAGGKFAVLGIGVNVNQTEFAPGLRERAISLRMVKGCEIPRLNVAAAILRRLDQWQSSLCADFHAILREATTRGSLLGRRVSIQGSEGIAESLDENGALRIRTDDGNELTIFSGEVRQGREH